MRNEKRKKTKSKENGKKGTTYCSGVIKTVKVGFELTEQYLN